ncbi:MAG: hypothetical protein JTT11_02940 [Candidatus Brockarchaeota archaeon]|nr:hypothetical protein [Candidatus Brockarchaeota archaeon]
MFVCSKCERGFKRFSEARSHLVHCHRVHRREVWNYLAFEVQHRCAKVVEYPWIFT